MYFFKTLSGIKIILKKNKKMSKKVMWNLLTNGKNYNNIKSSDKYTNEVKLSIN